MSEHYNNKSDTNPNVTLTNLSPGADALSKNNTATPNLGPCTTITKDGVVIFFRDSEGETKNSPLLRKILDQDIFNKGPSALTTRKNKKEILAEDFILTSSTQGNTIGNYKQCVITIDTDEDSCYILTEYYDTEGENTCQNPQYILTTYQKTQKEGEEEKSFHTMDYVSYLQKSTSDDKKKPGFLTFPGITHQYYPDIATVQNVIKAKMGDHGVSFYGDTKSKPIKGESQTQYCPA